MSDSSRPATGSDHRQEYGLHSLAFHLVRKKARRLIHSGGFGGEDQEDIEQELLLKVWEARGRFDPNISHPNVFLVTVIERAAVSLLRNRRALKRGSQLLHCSLAAPLESIANLPEHSPDVDFARDVTATLEQLPEELRAVADRLGIASKRSVARSLGISRRRLERHISDLRAKFTAAGLSENFFRFAGQSAMNREVSR